MNPHGLPQTAAVRCSCAAVPRLGHRGAVQLSGQWEPETTRWGAGFPGTPPRINKYGS